MVDRELPKSHPSAEQIGNLRRASEIVSRVHLDRQRQGVPLEPVDVVHLAGIIGSSNAERPLRRGSPAWLR